jgi:hypothetical protein
MERKEVSEMSIWTSDEEATPVDFLIGCAWSYAEEYLTSRPDLVEKLKEGERQLEERFDLPND